jgi:hypothetical protein
MKKIMTKAENFADESPMSRGKITLQYPLQFVRRVLLDKLICHEPE